MRSTVSRRIFLSYLILWRNLQIWGHLSSGDASEAALDVFADRRWADEGGANSWASGMREKSLRSGILPKYFGYILFEVPTCLCMCYQLFYKVSVQFCDIKIIKLIPKHKFPSCFSFRQLRASSPFRWFKSRRRNSSREWAGKPRRRSDSSSSQPNKMRLAFW